MNRESQKLNSSKELNQDMKPYLDFYEEMLVKMEEKELAWSIFAKSFAFSGTVLGAIFLYLDSSQESNLLDKYNYELVAFFLPLLWYYFLSLNNNILRKKILYEILYLIDNEK